MKPKPENTFSHWGDKDQVQFSPAEKYSTLSKAYKDHWLFARSQDLCFFEQSQWLGKEVMISV